MQQKYDKYKKEKSRNLPTNLHGKKVSELKADFNCIRCFRKRLIKREFYTNCNTPKLLSKLDKQIRHQPRHQISQMRKDDGTFTSTLDESLNVILNICFPGCKDYLPENDIEWQNLVTLCKTKGKFNRKQYEYLSIYRIKEAIRNTKPHKAAGPNHIKPVVLKNLPQFM